MSSKVVSLQDYKRRKWKSIFLKNLPKNFTYFGSLLTSLFSLYLTYLILTSNNKTSFKITFIVLFLFLFSANLHQLISIFHKKKLHNLTDRNLDYLQIVPGISPGFVFGFSIFLFFVYTAVLAKILFILIACLFGYITFRIFNYVNKEF
jgi:hypothetical protein